MSEISMKESNSPVLPGNRLRVHQLEPTQNGLDVKEAFGGSGDSIAEAIDTAAVETSIVEAIKTIYDPEIPVNIYELGLIYGVEVKDDGNAEIKMTLTAPACPVAGALVQEVADKAGSVQGVARSHVELVWDPPWTKDRMTEEALLELGLL